MPLGERYRDSVRAGSQEVMRLEKTVQFADISDTAIGVASISRSLVIASRDTQEPTMGHSLATGRRARTGQRIAALATLAALTMGARAEGLTLRAQESAYPAHPADEYALTSYHLSANSIRLFGDYYFFDPAQSDAGPALSSLTGGFRASTGLVGLAQPMSLYDAQQSAPYIGLGYSHLWLNSQLSLNADFGLASQNRGHGLFGSGASLDDVTSQLRWAPVMAVNVRYSF